MISFVWEPGLMLPAGTGGSENYTIGHVRELNRRGIPAQVVTVGVGHRDGRDDFAGIPFVSVRSIDDIADLAGTVVFVTAFPAVATRNPAYQVLHVPPPLREHERRHARAQSRGRILIATSKFAARLWAKFLDVPDETITVVYPFAETCFSTSPRTQADAGAIRILYAGRLSPEKGIYTLLATLHNDLIVSDPRLTFTVTTAGADKPQGRIIEGLLRDHPTIDLVPARKSPSAMAHLMASHDIVVMPSTGQYWHETFGIVSIEAQHAGCRVVVSDDGGLPETDCGAIVLIPPDNPEALADGIREAIRQGPLSRQARLQAAAAFTVQQSVDGLLAVLDPPRAYGPDEILDELEAIADLPPADPGWRERPIELTA